MSIQNLTELEEKVMVEAKNIILSILNDRFDKLKISANTFSEGASGKTVNEHDQNKDNRFDDEIKFITVTGYEYLEIEFAENKENDKNKMTLLFGAYDSKVTGKLEITYDDVLDNNNAIIEYAQHSYYKSKTCSK